MKKLLVAMVLGAALAYFLDPDNGPRRRRACRRGQQPPAVGIG